MYDGLPIEVHRYFVLSETTAYLYLIRTIRHRDNFVKCLGIVLCPQLTFKHHVLYFIDKDSKTPLIHRIAKDFTDVHCLKSLYCSLVHATLGCVRLFDILTIKMMWKGSNLYYDTSVGFPGADLLQERVECPAVLKLIDIYARSRNLRAGNILRLPLRL